MSDFNDPARMFERSVAMAAIQRSQGQARDAYNSLEQACDAGWAWKREAERQEKLTKTAEQKAEELQSRLKLARNDAAEAMRQCGFKDLLPAL